ncbi:MAG TPA: type II toxin-antitoxin system VapC family toxin [Patescibacteria group bacterium]|nr:type II toxin-antitoxin system VapC family toxin [Patescibacteria group bacterium]
MIIDTSVIIAMFRREPEAAAFAMLIDGAPVARISAGTYVELAVVIDGSRDAVASSALDPFLDESGIRIEPLTATQARIARTAYQRFGRGSGHPARLNMGDCFSYALARDLGEALLFKGDDFTLTDIELVSEPIKGRRLSAIVAGYGTTSP